MKSRTSSSKASLLKKDITRFFPVWGIYTLCLLVGLFLLGVEDLGFWFVNNIASGIPAMAVINCGYANAERGLGSLEYDDLGVRMSVEEIEAIVADME